MKVITVANIKGGSTKSTTAIHLGCSLAANHKVLAVDMDAQASLTDFFFPDTPPEVFEQAGVITLLRSETSLSESMHSTESLDVLPSHLELAGMSAEATRKPNMLNKLKVELSKCKTHEYAIIDTPGSISAELFASLMAADIVLVPVTPSKWTHKAVSLLLSEMKNVNESGGSGKVAIVPAMFGRSKGDQELLDQMESSFPVTAKIPALATIKKSTESGQFLKSGTVAAEAYMQLAESIKELLK